jgi:hypothetical protein
MGLELTIVLDAVNGIQGRFPASDYENKTSFQKNCKQSRTPRNLLCKEVNILV